MVDGNRVSISPIRDTKKSDMQTAPKPKITDYDDGVDNPALSDVVERNIRTILRLRAQSAHDRGFQDSLADLITSLSGRMSFVYFHVLWVSVRPTPYLTACDESGGDGV